MNPKEAWDVLVVDDEAVVRSAVCRVLEDQGFRVAAVGGSREALAHPAVESCRLALCDLVLPDGSGIDLIRALRRERPTLPVVLITGYATAEQEQRSLAAGAAFFVPKPFEESELLQVVHDALGATATPAKEESP